MLFGGRLVAGGSPAGVAPSLVVALPCVGVGASPTALVVCYGPLLGRAACYLRAVASPAIFGCHPRGVVIVRSRPSWERVSGWLPS